MNWMAGRVNTGKRAHLVRFRDDGLVHVHCKPRTVRSEDVTVVSVVDLHAVDCTWCRQAIQWKQQGDG